MVPFMCQLNYDAVYGLNQGWLGVICYEQLAILAFPHSKKKKNQTGVEFQDAETMA